MIESSDKEDQRPAKHDDLQQPPNGTFDRIPFDLLMTQYNYSKKTPAATLELGQALMMTANLKETAGQVSEQSGSLGGGQPYFFQNDFLGDTMRLSDGISQAGCLLGNLGPADKSTNFMLEQRNLLKAQAREGQQVRHLIHENIVDGLEYVKTKQEIAMTKQRMKPLLDVSDLSSSDDSGSDQDNLRKKKRKESDNSDGVTTEVSSEESKRQAENKKKIKAIIKQLRGDARRYLGVSDTIDTDKMSLQVIFRKLAKNKNFLRRRETKAVEKQIAMKDQLKKELEDVNKRLGTLIRTDNYDHQKLKRDLNQKIDRLNQVLGLEQRIKKASTDLISVAEIDAIHLNSNSFQLQNILFDFCGLSKRPRVKVDKHTKSIEKIFGKIKRLPSKAPIIQEFPKEQMIGLDGQNDSVEKVATPSQSNNQKQNAQELVRVVGLEPEKLFGQLDKYKVQVNKMPKFSNVFDSYETFVPGFTGSLQETTTTSVALPGQASVQSHIMGNSSVQNFARSDGRSVISLGFNPYELDSRQKRKIFEGTIKDIKEHRAQTTKQITPAAREKQEQVNLKRVWTNIAKRDIPKAYRAYQKYKTDLETNNKKLAVNCLKEVRKKVVKTQRLAKEAPVRAKKLTKEMLSYWKRRDRELADIKRKKEKFDKEMKKRQQEEEEALLQKKRLEYLMKQSEIYAHFISVKTNQAEDLEKAKKECVQEEEQNNVKRVVVDEENARRRIAQIINEDKKKVDEWDNIDEDEREENVKEEDLMEINKFEGEDHAELIQTPQIFKGTLKQYQLKGLRWLDNLYEQGINGILADEMGLGKTIQAISLMAHIAEHKGTWGPFLVIVPVSTLYNWQNEFNKFCPSLRVLPYFGSAEERKKLSKYLDPKNMGNPNMQIHVLITSYNLIVNNPKDQAKMMRVKWNYMILDEAQAIKNNLSRRWKVLLQFQARNRLLLTGTPIQNSMAELWALLHFIMPKLFDNHEQFNEWFSKDIEAASMSQGELNKHQLRRLHAILKPFMLRRLKRDVEQEIAPKTEKEIFCTMTYRQRTLYQRIRSKISTKDLFMMTESKKKMENLMNLVMQFRKVCNHPDLFERRIGRTPYLFSQMQIGVQQNMGVLNNPDVRCLLKNPVKFTLPKLVYDECFLISDNNTATHKLIRKGVDESMQRLSITNHLNFFNIFNTDNLHRESKKNNSGFGILNVLCSSNKWSSSELSYLFVADPIMRLISLAHFHTQKHKVRVHNIFGDLEANKKVEPLGFHTTLTQSHRQKKLLDIQAMDFAIQDQFNIFYRPNKIVSMVDNSLDVLPSLICTDLSEKVLRCDQQDGDHLASLALRQDLSKMFVDPVLARPIDFECPTSGPFNRYKNSLIHMPMAKKVFFGDSFKPYASNYLARCSYEDQKLAFLNRNVPQIPSKGFSNQVMEEGVMNSGVALRRNALVDLPQHGRLITDCAKMGVFAELIMKLHAEKHRCLVFCQMTRMLDILEDFMTWKKLPFFRMDGSTSTQDRGAMVDQFQANDQIFAFLLSTRAGGLGLNLIAADTVIFYDNDWNPTMDEQAMDRVHRIGQTKKVTVYRIITKGTVEERIVKRATQKQNVQSTVYGDTFKMKEVVDFVMADEDNSEEPQDKDEGPKLSFIKTGRRKKDPKAKAAEKEKGSAKATPKKAGRAPKINKMPEPMDFDQDADEFDEEQAINMGKAINMGNVFDEDDDGMDDFGQKRGRGRPPAKKEEINIDEDQYMEDY